MFNRIQCLSDRGLWVKNMVEELVLCTQAVQHTQKRSVSLFSFLCEDQEQLQSWTIFMAQSLLSGLQRLSV